MRRRLLSALLILMSLFIMATDSLGDIGQNHNKDMEAVFFGEDNKGKRKLEKLDVSKAAQYLEDAAYLTIDQFSNAKDKRNGQSHVDSLRELIDSVPDISEIDVEATAQNHRQFSHLGWNSNYHSITEMEGKQRHDEEWYKIWEKRKKIMQDTVEAIFDFTWWNGIPIVNRIFPDYGEKCDSMCALVYYVHLLGDHRETGTKKQYDMLLPLGGQFNEKDIVHELMYHLKILFPTLQNSREFHAVKQELSSINMKCYDYYRTSDEKEMLQKNKDNAIHLLEVLKANIPILMSKSGYLKAMQELDAAG